MDQNKKNESRVKTAFNSTGDNQHKKRKHSFEFGPNKPYKHSPTFANDRLKKLREKLKEEVSKNESNVDRKYVIAKRLKNEYSSNNTRTSSLSNHSMENESSNRSLNTKIKNSKHNIHESSINLNNSLDSRLKTIKENPKLNFNSSTNKQQIKTSEKRKLNELYPEIIIPDEEYFHKIETQTTKIGPSSSRENRKKNRFSSIHYKKPEVFEQSSTIVSSSTKNITFSINTEASTSKGNSINSWFDYGRLIDDLFNKHFTTTSNSGRRSSNEDNSMDWEELDEDTEDDNETIREIHIVIDTNILLGELDVLKEIVANGSKGGTKPILYVPWMVVSELDLFKDDRNTPEHLKRKAQNAIKFINETMIENGNKLIGQNVFDAESQKTVGKSPDDKILACCLQAKEKFKHIIMLSNDFNLRNKLLIHEIPSISCMEMFTAKKAPQFDQELALKFEKISKEMSDCCSYIICECAKVAYGNVWNKMAMFSQKQPWSLKMCIQIFKKYWSGIFNTKLLKHAYKTIEELLETLRKIETVKNQAKFDEFVKGCISFCFYLKDIEEHRDVIEKCVKEIKKIIGENT